MAEGLEEVRVMRLTAEEIGQILLRHRAILIVAAREAVASRTRPCALAGPASIALVVGAHLIVFLAFFRIGQNLVSFVDLFKFVFSARIARIHVRVILPRQLTIGLPNLFVLGVFAHAQNFIIILI